jgi:cellulose synthase/poly-beta-1,6-N-acetylglucosamine synthase-like glycosyltransferase
VLQNNLYNITLFNMTVENSAQADCLSVIVPAYNEETTLADVIGKVIAVVPSLLEIIIVDDCSTDQTGEIAQRLGMVWGHR